MMQLRVKTSGGERVQVEVGPEDTVSTLKSKISSMLKLPLAEEQQKVMYRGKPLENDKRICDYKLSDRAQLMVIKLPKLRAAKEAAKTEDTPDVAPVLCTKGCGFYGDPSREGMCSQCYKTALSEKRQAAKVKPMGSEGANAGKEEEEEEKPVVLQTDFTKCWKCKRNTGLLGFACACGYKFCAKHRYREEHKCSLDSKKDLQKLVLANPGLSNEKITRF